MAKFPAIVTTTQGLNIISAALAAGKSIVFTRLCVGDGTTETAFADLTGMVNICLQLGATSADNIGNGHYVIHATLDNSTVDAGFYCRELGVYAKVEGENTDQLFAYTNAGSECDFIPDKSYPIDSQVFNVDLLIGNDAAITLIRSDETYVSVADIENHNTDPTAHAAGIAGNAATATALENSRTIRTDLASTSAASFDGTANVTPGVTGVLPVANGGTGNAQGLAPMATADANGNTISSTYLPLAGGTMTGILKLSQITQPSTSSRLFLYSGSTYSWDDDPVIYIHGVEYSSNPGAICIHANNGTNHADSFFYPTGGVKLGFQTVGSSTTPIYFNGGVPTACSAALGSGGGIVAASYGNNGYIKFASGVVFQWGRASVTSETATAITLPLSMSSGYAVLVSKANTTSGNSSIPTAYWSGTSKIIVYTLGTSCHWFCVGKA